MDWLDKAQHDAMKPNTPKEPRVSTKREPSKTERDAEWLGIGFGIMFCVHKKSYFESCNGCRRDMKRANMLKEHFIQKYLTPSE